jgi:PhoPQ-activated pathogenicity-related protein
LDRYVAAPDTNYTFKLLNTATTPVGKVHVLEMISQAWLITNEVDRPRWQHWLTVAVPRDVAHRTALLFITGGSNDKGPPKKPEGELARIAVETRSVAVELRNVPNQPLEFGRDGERRVEDDLIAYTWDKFLRTRDEKWPARLPMTKSAVRAMDTVVAFCDSPQGGMTKVDGFVVAGGSKRGWTTWTTAAVDRRVVAIIPVVIDVLNIEPSFKHHFEAYGFYAPAVHDYEEMHIMEWQGTPQYRALMKIVEPYEYRPRLTMPKFIINATGDQFFLPDSSRYYFDDLPGIKYLRYVPNADHSLKGSDGWLTLIACYQAVLTSAPLPKFSWTVQEGGALRVETVDKPEEVKLWQATNPNARDFRLETLGPVWTSSMLNDQGNGIYVAKVPAPAKGWTAFLVELTFANKGGLGPFKFTTGVQVVPDTVPHTFRPKAK